MNYLAVKVAGTWPLPWRRETPTSAGTERALTGRRRGGVWLFLQQFVQMGLFTLCGIPLLPPPPVQRYHSGEPRGGFQHPYCPWQPDRCARAWNEKGMCPRWGGGGLGRIIFWVRFSLWMIETREQSVCSGRHVERSPPPPPSYPEAPFQAPSLGLMADSCGCSVGGLVHARLFQICERFRLSLRSVPQGSDLGPLPFSPPVLCRVS